MSNLPNTVIVHFDGACWPNPGGTAAYGYAILDPEGNQLLEGSGMAEKGPLATNNVAEYVGLLEAAKYLKSENYQGVVLIRSDSKLVVNQLEGNWNINKPHLQKLRDECYQTLKGLKYQIEWVPRNQNKLCDGISKKALKELTAVK